MWNARSDFKPQPPVDWLSLFRTICTSETWSNRVLRSSLRNWLVNHMAAANYNQQNIHPPSSLHAIWWCLDTRHVKTLSLSLYVTGSTHRHSLQTFNEHTYLFVPFEIRKALPVFLLQTPLDQPRCFCKEETAINSSQFHSRALRYLAHRCAVKATRQQWPGKPSFGTISPCYQMNKIEGNVC